MKGLEVAKDFYFGWGHSFLKKEFPHIENRIAAGRLDGSDAIGADDEISQDHDWGPQFTLFLSAEDYAVYGEQLSEKANTAAPADWNGFRLKGAESKNVIVVSIPNWFEIQFELTCEPHDDFQWSNLLNYESRLYNLRHGAIWVDGLGLMTEWRNRLHHYPELPLTRRLIDECFRTWHHGEYNFVMRMAKRRDPIATSICIGEFVSGVMRVFLLANGNYTPYWKWLSFAFRKEPGAGAYVPSLERLVQSADIDEQVVLVNEISAMIHIELQRSCHLTGSANKPYLLPLLNDCNELRSRLRNLEKKGSNKTDPGDT